MYNSITQTRSPLFSAENFHVKYITLYFTSVKRVLCEAFAEQIGKRKRDGPHNVFAKDLDLDAVKL